ncbi:hypothetical protein PMAYCL1PPCAC_20529, partial [Pristionchus mayeri]
GEKGETFDDANLSKISTTEFLGSEKAFKKRLNEISARRNKSRNSSKSTVDFDGNSLKGIEKGSAEDEQVKKRKKPTKTSSKSAVYLGYSDEDEEPLMKIPKSESEGNEKSSSGKGSSNSHSSKKEHNGNQKNELECPECQYRSMSVNSWLDHLRRSHSTTPAMAGCFLRCECGHETVSHAHQYRCEISKFTVIRCSVAPKCVLCEMRPKSQSGYAKHLKVHHSTKIEESGYYLKCACGFRADTDHHSREHFKQCPGREFTVHKLKKK